MSDALVNTAGQQLPSEEEYIPYMILFLTYVLNVQDQYQQANLPHNASAIFDVFRAERLALGHKLGLPDGGEDFMKKLERNLMYLPSLAHAATAFASAKLGYSPGHVGCPSSMAVLDLLAEKCMSLKPASAKTV